MNIAKEIGLLRGTILKEVERAAKDDDISRVAQWSALAKECEELETDATALTEKVIAFKDQIKSRNMRERGSQLSARSPHEDTRYQKGEKARKEWLDQLNSSGIRLTGTRKRFRTMSGQSVAVAFASELDGGPGSGS